jgi:EmrB/QacA subfamily drug resistance transporter
MKPKRLPEEMQMTAQTLPTASAAPARTPVHRVGVVGVVVVGIFMAGLDLFIVNIAFPQLERDFAGTSIGTLSWVLNAYAIVFAALLIPAGRWADAVGRKRAFLLGLAVFTAASAACAASPSVNFLIGARAVQAVGAALLVPTSLGLLLPAFPPERRHVAIGIWAAVGGIAAAAGPPLGGVLVQASWRWVFLVNVPVGLVSLVVAWRSLAEVRHPNPVRPDLVGAALLSGSVASLVVAIVKGSDWGWTSAPVVGFIALAAGLLALLVTRSARHPAPILEPELLRVRAFTVAVTASVLFFMAFGTMLLASVLFLTGVWHESVLDAGLMLAPGPAMAATFAIPGSRLGGRYGPGVVGAAGAVLFAGGAGWWLSHVGNAVHWASDMLPGQLIVGAGVGLVLPSLTAAAAVGLPPARLATGIAAQTTGRQIGSALGVAVLVAVLGTPHSASDFAGAWELLLAASLSAGLLMLVGVGRAARPAPAREVGTAAVGAATPAPAMPAG